LTSRDVNIEYLYCFIEKSGESAIVVLRVEDVEGAKQILNSGGVRIPAAEEVYKI